MKKKPFSLPTIAALLMLVVGIIVGVFYIQTRQTFNLSATPSEEPKDVRITNITDSNFAVSWVTDKPTFGYVTYEKSEALLAGHGTRPKSTLHHLTVKNLDANTNYQFKIGSNETLFDNKGSFFRAKTGPVIALTKKTDMVFGKILTKEQRAVSGALVYLTISGASPLSTISDNDGSWAINLAHARDTSLKSLASYTKNTTLEIYVFGDYVKGEKEQIATAKVSVEGAKPVPNMVLGENYNYANNKTLKSGDDLPSSDISFEATKSARER